MFLEDLDVKNDSYDAETWEDLNALYRGGRVFRDRIYRFLHQNALEPEPTYQRRLKESTYHSHLGPIIDYYAAWLFSGDFDVRAKRGGETIDAPPEYASFREDVCGDVDFKDFLKERFTRALVEGRSHWVLELPVAKTLDIWPQSKAEFREVGLKKATLRPIDAGDLWDWDVDDAGKYIWASVHSVRRIRGSIRSGRTVIERWEVYDREFCEVFELQYKDGERPQDPKTVVRSLGTYKHGFMAVPICQIDTVKLGLWMADRLSDAQIAHFRSGAALDWNIKQTCYAMPIFNVEDAGKPPTMGAGYGIMIGLNEKFGWSSPNHNNFDVLAREVDAKRNDIYRMAHQMALGLDNNAETVGRSADSKAQDNAATRVMLQAYGRVVAEAVEETYEMVSDAWGDTDIEWSIEGFSGYDTATAPEVIGNVMNAQLLNIPSKTFLAEAKTKAALAMLPELSQDVKDAIRKEIKAGVEKTDDLYELFTATPPAPPDAGGTGTGGPPKSQGAEAGK